MTAWGLTEWKDFAEIVKDFAELAGVVIALLKFWQAVEAYALQVRDKRAQQFLALRTDFRNSADYQKIIQALYGERHDYSNIPYSKRIEFMAFFEAAALLMNSGLISKEVASYMFGGDALKAWDDPTFLTEQTKTEEHWKLVRDFADEARGYQYKSGSVKV
jgi:hypothetical protein